MESQSFMKTNFTKILNELSYRVSSGIPDLTNEQHLMKLWDVLKEHNWNVDARVEMMKNLHDMNPNKLFNYMIQLMETENNIKILNELQPKLENFESKLVLYNYDSFLFDFNTKDGLDFLNMVKQTIESDGKYPVKISRGVNYHEMQDITEKFK